MDKTWEGDTHTQWGGLIMVLPHNHRGVDDHPRWHRRFRYLSLSHENVGFVSRMGTIAIENLKLKMLEQDGDSLETGTLTHEACAAT